MNAYKTLNHRYNELEIIFEQNKIKQKQITAKWNNPKRSFFDGNELIHSMNLMTERT